MIKERISRQIVDVIKKNSKRFGPHYVTSPIYALGGGTGGGGFFGRENECYSRERSGYKFFSFRVRDIFNSLDVDSCSKECGRSFNCKSFSFNQYKSIDNCHISDVDLRFSQDLLDDITPDSDWNLYRQSDSSQCSSNSGGSGMDYSISWT